MTKDEAVFLAENPIATIDQREIEDTALRLVARPELHKARAVASFLWREAMKHDAGEQFSQLDAMLDEYIFHYALRAANSDASRPRVARFMAPPHHWFGRDVPGSRWAGDSPDFVYRTIAVAHGPRFEIRGRPTCETPPTVNYALMGDNTAAPTILGLLDSLDMTTDANGEFVITVDPTPAGGRKNHIQTHPGAWQIWIRDALGDWTTQSANALWARRLDPADEAPLSDEALAQRAARGASDGVYYAFFCIRGQLAKPPNEFTAPASSGPLGGMATQFTSGGNISLAEDEAMIITTSGAGAGFRNAVLHDVYMRSLNYWETVSSLNMVQMAPDDDGRFTYVVAHKDPGVHNWLDTGGLRQTIFGHRWQAFPRGGAGEAPVISTRVLKWADLPTALPPGVKRIDAQGRKDQIAARTAGFRRRFAET